ncbi:MAG TPA: phage tail tape measure C-terminal domain-containing protein [Rhizomicrobium sp.]|jgi:phage-related minor tail protein|nr:phage tail tape measure C-terminal domain-containing protein [Rhizomicrobium sp.]
MADDTANKSLAAAGQALNDFASGPVLSATSAIESAVTRSFNAVSNTVARAALSGRDSISQMAASVLADFDRIAASQFIVKPVEGLVASAIGALMPVAGARATGGPVAPGGSYLVGERGPELFTPSVNGEITANAALTAGRAAPVVVNITTPDAASFQKSRSQVAAMLARAIQQGNRNL